MTETIKSKIKTIKAVADAILKHYLKTQDGQFGMSPEGFFADFKIVDASYHLYFDGKEAYNLSIKQIPNEFFCPMSEKFQRYMIECLKDKLGFYVDVILEW